MADKYLYLGTNGPTEKELLQTTAGAGDAGKGVALDSAGLISASMMPVGVGADTASIVASESLSAGDCVNIWDDASTPKVRKADASAYGTRAMGFVLSSYTTAQTALVYFEGKNTQKSGLTIGAKYYLSETAGEVTTVKPTTSGAIVQAIGESISATALSTEIGESIIRA